MSDDKDLLDPKNNDLIPDLEPDSNVAPPNDLVPGFSDALNVDALRDGLNAFPVMGGAQATLAEGLRLEARDGGGLSVFKGERHVRDLGELSAVELELIRKYIGP